MSFGVNYAQEMSITPRNGHFLERRQVSFLELKEKRHFDLSIPFPYVQMHIDKYLRVDHAVHLRSRSDTKILLVLCALSTKRT
jgi:hypothetical protein